MTLPRTVVAPRTGPETRLIALNLGLVSSDRGEGGAAKPTVLDFYASWCQPCKQLEPIIEKAKSQYGEKVNFMTINVDDPSNEQIIDQYGVSPIPTVVFLSPDGQVVTYSIGFAGEKVLENGLKKILKG
jgi:thioredoxin 1